jgi:hypothetical protein
LLDSVPDGTTTSIVPVVAPTGTFDQIITIKGKGGKRRVVPMSLELRKGLFRWLGKHTQPLVFGTFRGTKQNQRNVLQDLKDLGNELGISGVRFSFQPLDQYRQGFVYDHGTFSPVAVRDPLERNPVASPIAE